MTTETHLSVHRTARFAGGLYLAPAPPACFSFVCLPSGVLIRDDPAATPQNVIAPQLLLRLGVVWRLQSQAGAFVLQHMVLGHHLSAGSAASTRIRAGERVPCSPPLRDTVSGRRVTRNRPSWTPSCCRT